MPRKPRFFLPDVPVHIVQRGHNRENVFLADEDYTAYLRWLSEAAVKYECKIHAYCLMTNHIHILASPTEVDGITRMMQYVGRYYVPYFNHKYGKSGSIWEGRYKSNLVGAEDYLLACMRYIELNPVKAGMVKRANQYPWSSYAYNAGGQENALITPHEVYLSLGDEQTRLVAYKKLFKAQQDTQKKTGEALVAALQTGTPLGGETFIKLVERVSGQKVGQARRGRPTGYKVKKEEPDQGDSQGKTNIQNTEG